MLVVFLNLSQPFLFVSLFEMVSLNPGITESSGLPVDFRDPPVSPHCPTPSHPHPCTGTAGTHSPPGSSCGSLVSEFRIQCSHHTGFLVEPSSQRKASGVSTTLVNICEHFWLFLKYKFPRLKGRGKELTVTLLTGKKNQEFMSLTHADLKVLALHLPI